MKLHLPKQLFTALLAAISFIAPAAYTVAAGGAVTFVAYQPVSAAVSMNDTTITVTGSRYQVDGGSINQDAALDANDVNANALNTSGKKIIIGSSAQLFLQTWANPIANNGSIVLTNNITVQAGSGRDSRGGIRFGNDGSNYTTTLSGVITLEANAMMHASGTNEININGAVTGDYSLDVRGHGYTFAGPVTVSGLVLQGDGNTKSNEGFNAIMAFTGDVTADTLEVKTNTKVTIGSNAAGDTPASKIAIGNITNAGTLTLGTEDSTINLSGTITNSGTLTLKGAFTAASFDEFATTIYGTLSNTTHGYAAGRIATVIASSGTSGGTINRSDFSFTLGETDITESLTTDSGSVLYIAEDAATTTSTIYEITSAYTTAVEYNATSGGTAGATGFKLANGTTVKLTGSDYSKLEAGITIDAGNDGSATVSIANGATQTYASLGLDSLINVESGAYVLNIDGTGTVVSTDQTGSETGFHTAGEISITNGGTLELKNQDALGWSTPTPAINIENATLKVGARQTMATSINMKGGATITATDSPTGTNDSNAADGDSIPMLHSLGYTLAASGLNNVIESSVGIGIQHNFTIDVDGESSSLAIKGAFYTRVDQTGAIITKSGSGTLILDGEEKTIDQNIDVTGGTLQIGSEESTSNLVTLVRGVDQSEGSQLNIIGKAKLTGTSTLRSVSVASTGELTFGGTTTLYSTITNAGSIIIDKGTDAVNLNSLLGGSIGEYKNISNTGDGYITVTGSGTKSLSGDITLNTGGNIVLTGGSFGTEESAISYSIASGTNKTVLEFKDIDAYIGGAVSLDMKVNDGATVNLGIAAQSKDIRFNVTENGRLVFNDTQTANMTHQVSGSGTVKVTFGTTNHDYSIKFGETFAGTVEVSGNFNVMDENFMLAENATLKLMQGQVWSKPNTATVLSQNIELAQKGETNQVSFIGGGSLTLNGAVTGDYLETTGTLVLNNANNHVTELKVSGGTTTINNGTYDTITLSGGTTTINNGTYGTITLSGGTTTINNGTYGTITLSGGTTIVNSSNVVDDWNKITFTGGKLQFGGGVTHVVDTSIACNDLTLSSGLDEGTVVEFWGQNNSFNHLDLAESGNEAKGTIHFRATQEAASATTVANNIWMNQNATSIQIYKNASLTWKGATVKGGDTAEHATIKNTGAAGTVTYKTGGLNIKDAELIINNIIGDTAEDKTIGAKLESTALTNGTTSELTVNNAGNTITKLTAEAGNVKLNETMRVDDISAKEDKVVSIAAGKTLNMGEGSKVQLSGTDSTAAASMTAKTDSAMARLQEDASFTIQDMTLTNTTITAATTTQVKLQNVTANNVVLAQGKFSTDADMGVEVGVGGSGSSLVFEGGLAENEIITIKAREGASLAVDLGDLSCVTAMGPGKYDLSITLSGVKLDFYTDLAVGAGITFEGWLGELIGASSGVKVSFSEAVAEETSAAAAEGGAATGVTYSTGSVGTVIRINGLNVPLSPPPQHWGWPRS